MLTGFRPLLPYSFLLFFIQTHAQTDTSEQAFSVFRSYLQVAEDYAACRNLNSIDFEEFQERIIALEELTGIISHDDGSCWSGNIREPVSYNINDWNLWFQLNKTQLVFDEEKGVLKTVGNSIPIERNPTEYFLTLVTDMEQMLINHMVFWDRLKYISYKLDVLTDYRKNHFFMECTCDENDELYPIGTLHGVEILKEWYAENHHRLYWDMETQQLAVRN